MSERDDSGSSRGPRLLIVTDLHVADERATCRAVAAVVRAAPPASVAIGVRDHGASARVRVDLARRLIDLARPFGAIVAVHDRLDLALAARADGVHLGHRSLPASDARALLGDGAWVSRSCHDAGELAVAEAERVDAATLGPLFSTPLKGAPLGLDSFRVLRGRFPDVHLLALGGVDPTNVASAREAGADGVGVVRAVLAARDPGAAAAALLRAFLRLRH